MIEILPHKPRTNDRDLVAVNNGIFNFQTKQLISFSPDYIFLTKSKVNYVENAPSPKIVDDNGRVWDVDFWIHDLFDDPELETLIWEILSAIVRPFACWDKLVPFSKSFQNSENKAIKDDYLNRKEVLEYVLWRALNMKHTKLSEPKACKEALGDFEESNDTFLQLMNEVLPEFVWDLLPFGFLYDLYCAWMRRNARSSEVMNKNRFIDRVIGYIENNTEWECPGRKHTIRSANKMGWLEPLIAEYDLRNWNDSIPTELAVLPKLKATYCGLQRRTPRGNPKAMLSCSPYPHNGH